jgi:membrane-bound serine protease (ClpP class)
MLRYPIKLASLSLLVLALLLTVGSGAAAAQDAPGAPADGVYVITIDGIINPMSANYLERGLRQSREAGAQAVVLKLNTPGGLESSMRQMTQAMLASPIPVIVYVTPAGGRAASAGMFITIAGHVAAMEPGTNIGAAHPVGMGGEIDEVSAAKITNDAAALARSLATIRERNAEWAEQAVRESVSITAEEAVQQNVVDLTAANLEDLLTQIDGRVLRTPAGEVTLRTAGAPVVDLGMTVPERILQAITDPNIAFILLTIGAIGIIAELYNPGTLFPGVTGALALVLAFVALGNLPVNWAGAGLILFAVVLLVVDIYTEGIGLLALGALVAFVLGALMLYEPFTPTSPAMPDLQVNRGLIAVTAALGAGFVMFAGRAVLRTRRKQATTGAEGLVGHVGVALTELSPEGLVRAEGERWNALSEEGPIEAGARVVVVGMDGLTLRVKKAQK